MLTWSCARRWPSRRCRACIESSVLVNEDLLLRISLCPGGGGETWPRRKLISLVPTAYVKLELNINGWFRSRPKCPYPHEIIEVPVWRQRTIRGANRLCSPAFAAIYAYRPFSRAVVGHSLLIAADEAGMFVPKKSGIEKRFRPGGHRLQRPDREVDRRRRYRQVQQRGRRRDVRTSVQRSGVSTLDQSAPQPISTARPAAAWRWVACPAKEPCHPAAGRVQRLQCVKFNHTPLLAVFI
jgi:hypothetical protein